MATVPTTSRRAQHRAELLDDVRRVALEQIATGGPEALSISGIARAVGVSAPSLYHYFASREELLAEIVLDSHADLTAFQEAATRRAEGLAPEQRFRVAADAARDWTLANPQRFRLLFSTAPGARTLRAAEIIPVARRGLAQFLIAVAALDPAPREEPAADPALAAQVAAAFADEATLAGVAPHVLLAGYLAHVRLLGLVQLEVAGVFEGSGIDLDRMYVNEVEQIIAELCRA